VLITCTDIEPDNFLTTMTDWIWKWLPCNFQVT